MCLVIQSRLTQSTRPVASDAQKDTLDLMKSPFNFIEPQPKNSWGAQVLPALLGMPIGIIVGAIWTLIAGTLI